MQILTPEAFEAFKHIFDKAMFCLGEEQGMLVNDECSLWYNRLEIFSCQFGKGGKKCLMAMD